MREPDLSADGAPDPGIRVRWSSARAAVASAQKPGGGVPAYTRWVNRRLARQAAAAAAALRLTPDSLTWFSLAFSLSGFAILIAAPITWWSGLIVAGMLAIAYVLDSADGQLARLQARSGPAGEWLDHVVDSARSPALHLTVAVAATLADLPLVVVITALLMSVAVSAQFMSQILAEQLLRRGGGTPRVGGDRQSWLLLPTDPGVWAWLFVLWGFGLAFWIGYVGLAAINAAHMAVSMRRRRADLVRHGEGY